MRLIWRAGCEDGPCPNVYDVDDQDVDDRRVAQVAIQGEWLTDPGALGQIKLPAHEVVVLIPRELLLEYARAELDGELAS